MKKYAAIAVILASVGFTAQAEEKKDTNKGFYVIAPKSRIYIQGRAILQAEGVTVTDTKPTATTQAPNVLLTPRLMSGSSYLRFRGEYDLGDKWMAWAQLEGEIALDAGSSPFSDLRNSAAGLTGPYGTLQFGKWDTPLKSLTIGLDPYGGIDSMSFYNVFGQQLGGNSVSGNKWNSRIGNNVMYTTPRFSGVQGAVMAATPEATVGTLRPYLVSASISYNGPVYVGVAYEYRKNVDTSGTATTGIASTATGNRTTDQAFRAGASYKYNPTFTRVAVAFEWLKAANDSFSGGFDYSKTTFFGAITQGVMSDTHQIVLTGGLANDYSVTNAANMTGTLSAALNTAANGADTGAKYFSVAYHYNWTSDLKLYAGYVRLMNSDKGLYQIGSGGVGLATGTNAATVGQYQGMTNSAYTLGFQYLF